MSPTIVCAPTSSPPPPMPWMARKMISSVIVSESPASTDPTRKITIAAWKKIFRPYRSPSFPQSGVETVEASRYAVTIQESLDRLCRSPAMVGSAVATIVWSRAASSIPSSSPVMTTRTWRELSGSGPAWS
jgi:hypothetical protein